MSSATARTRYSVTVDTEEEWDWNSGYPTGATSVQNIAELRRFQDICTQAKSAVTYFTNHAVFDHDESRQVIQELSRQPQVEIGLHIHPWNTPPVAATPSVPVRESFLHNLPWDQAEAKLHTTLEAFEQAGLKPTSFRGGRYSSSPQIQNYLRKQGVWVDCSVLPYNTWSDDQAPDYRHRNPDPRRVMTTDGQPLWELPLSYGYTRRPFGLWKTVLDLAQSPPGKLLRITGILDRLGIVSRAWLNFEQYPAKDVLKFLAVLRKMKPPFVSFTLHSSSLFAGGSPYAKTPADVNRILETTRTVLETVATWSDFEPATMTEIATHLEAAQA